jgi:uncharacterized membrane protein/predicted TIM-barrel fold metal-dependent hydrolase
LTSIAICSLSAISAESLALQADDTAAKPPGIHQYDPVSQLKANATALGKASFPVIDVHSHFQMRTKGDPDAVDQYVDVMDENRIAINFSLDATIGDEEAHFEFLKPHAERFAIIGHIDFQGSGKSNDPSTWACNQGGFVHDVCERLKKAKASGIVGVKFFKKFGLGYRDADGRLLKIDDPKWDKIWQTCGELNLPIIMHTGDPAAFFEPVDENNERYEELLRHPNWSFHGKDFPAREELLAARNRVIEKHPGTTFIGAHIAGNAEDLATVSEWLDKYPNLYVELASRISELGRQPYSANAFLEKYSDRVLFGTDGPWPNERLKYYWRFLETDDEHFRYSEKQPPPQGLWRIHGVNLGDEALRNIYHANALKLFPSVKSKFDAAVEMLEAKFAAEEKTVESENAWIEQIRFKEPIIKSDAVIFGILMAMLAAIFWTSSHKRGPFAAFYKVIPMLLVCYFLPSLLRAFGIVNPEDSQVPRMAKDYLLPASLILLTLSVDLKEILKLGPKAIIMFVTGTLGVVLGGPIAVLLTSAVAPEIVGGEAPTEIWRGLATVAGSWIGGGANQAAMQEVFLPIPTDNAAVATKARELYSVMIAIDVLVAEFWMVFLLLGVGKADAIDRFMKADASAVKRLQDKMEAFAAKIARVPTTVDLMVILGIAFGGTGLCHYLGSIFAPWIETNYPFLTQFSLHKGFFWLVVLATTMGLLMSFTPLRNYEGAGASKIGTVCVFVLVATIGLNMDVLAIFEHKELFVVGLIWMAFHVGLMFFVGWLIKAPYFFLAVGSKANIGGAASAPVVAAAFHPALAPVGVLLAVLGYVLGTYGATLCAVLMQAASPS